MTSSGREPRAGSVPASQGVRAATDTPASRPDQNSLFKLGKPVAPLRPLTERQRVIYQMVCDSPDGLEPIELGALMHAQSGRHEAEEFCDLCGRDAGRALRERAIRQRVVRRSTGVYEPRDEHDWTGKAQQPTSQLAVLPGDSFEEIFQGGEAA